jgi:hypothetical protein
VVRCAQYRDVFWKTLNIQGTVFAAAGIATFAVLIGAFHGLKPPGFGERFGSSIIISGRPVTLPIGPVLSLLASLASAVIALGAAAGLSSDWPTIALWWYGQPTVNPSSVIDPIFGRPLEFYLFTLPALQLAAGWFMTLAVLTFGLGLFFFMMSSSATGVRQRGSADAVAGRRLLLAGAPLIAYCSPCASISGGSNVCSTITPPCRHHVYRRARHGDRRVARRHCAGGGRHCRRGRRVHRPCASAGSQPRFCLPPRCIWAQAQSARMSRALS